jgi:hypothetical protein
MLFIETVGFCTNAPASPFYKNCNIAFGGLILVGIFALGETGSFFDLNILHSFLFVGIGGGLILAVTKDKLIRFGRMAKSRKLS